MAFEDMYISDEFTYYLAAIRAGLVLRGISTSTINTWVNILTALIPTMSDINKGKINTKEEILRYVESLRPRFPIGPNTDDYLKKLRNAIAISILDTDTAKDLIANDFQ